MSYRIIIAKSAVKDFEKLTSSVRVSVKKAVGKYLKDKPKRVRKTRIKKLTGLKQPQFRLRAGDVRVFYDVNEEGKRVEILGFVTKSDAKRWLKKKGVQK